VIPFCARADPNFDPPQTKPQLSLLGRSLGRMSTQRPPVPSLAQSLASSESTLEQHDMTDTKAKAVKSVRMEPDRVDSSVTQQGTVSEPDDVHDETTDHDHSEEENDGSVAPVIQLTRLDFFEGVPLDTTVTFLVATNF